MYPAYDRLVAVHPGTRCEAVVDAGLDERHKPVRPRELCGAPAYALVLGRHEQHTTAHIRCLAHIYTMVTATGSRGVVHDAADAGRVLSTEPTDA